MTGPVLCAVDISDENRDRHVLERAAQLAKLDGTSIDLITVVPDYGMSVVGSFFDKSHHRKAEEEARRRLNALGEAVLGPEANAQVRHIVATGNAYEEILHVAEADGASLIVVGAHKPDFRDYLLGPNAARIVRHASVSVYVVR
ncbi:MAG: universal stress protein [Paracoccaceae bacterium]